MQALVWVGILATVGLASWSCVEIAREALRGHMSARATRLHLALMAALGVTCLALLVLGVRAHQRWSLFVLLALPFVGLCLWSDLRLLGRPASRDDRARGEAR